MKIKLR